MNDHDNLDELDEVIDKLETFASVVNGAKPIADTDVALLVNRKNITRIINKTIELLRGTEPVEPDILPGEFPGEITLWKCGACGAPMAMHWRYCPECGKEVLK